MAMKKNLKAVVLAAGKSTRMRSSKSKMVHPILGKEIINFLLDSLIEAGLSERDIVIVVGENENEIRGVVHKQVQYAIQEQQLGTAHALLSAGSHIRDHQGDVLVLVGDNPYITADALEKLLFTHRDKKAACSFISAIFPHTPPPYGRVIRDHDGSVVDVIEEADATPPQLQIREVNSSIYAFDNRVVFPRLSRIENRNVKKEYYLTDIIRILKNDRFRVEAVPAEDYTIAIGINNRWELQEALKKFNEKNQKKLAYEKGVTILQPETTIIEYDVEIGQDTVIYPFSYIASGTVIGKNCQIGPLAYLKNASIKDDVTFSFGKIAAEKVQNPD